MNLKGLMKREVKNNPLSPIGMYIRFKTMEEFIKNLNKLRKEKPNHPPDSYKVHPGTFCLPPYWETKRESL